MRKHRPLARSHVTRVAPPYLQKLRDLFPDFFGCRGRFEALQDFALFPNQELCEIPRDVFVSIATGISGFEELVEIAGVVTVHVDLREERKRRVVLGRHKLEDLRVGPRLLRAELVARKAENLETLGIVFIV